MHTMIFARARDNSQKSWKNLGNCDFNKCVQKLTKAKFQVFGVLSVYYNSMKSYAL